MALAVLMASGEVRSYEANMLQIAPDGSLILNFQNTSSGKERFDPQSGRRFTEQIQESKIVRVLRRDLWAEVWTPEETADEEPAVLDLRPLAAPLLSG